MQRFTCDCGNVLFFGSSRCLKCSSDVGYDPQCGVMLRVRPDSAMKRCDNGVKHSVCNWLLPASATATLCIACRMNRTIPDLSTPRNRMLWARMEMAKRRLIYTLLRIGITLPSKKENPRTGLAFDIVSTLSNPSVTTGHLNGVITVNLEEADDSYRQFNQQQLGENSRTLLGHFRHESAHYLWQRHLSELPWDDPQRLAFRERFGDEWLDYSAALTRHYEKGAPPDWTQNYITAYAASHPWEDWAETWAHYLHLLDTVETAYWYGLGLAPKAGEDPSLTTIADIDPYTTDAFDELERVWFPVIYLGNSLNRSMGQPDLYPFVLTPTVLDKLRFVHHVARGAAAPLEGALEG